jgi:acetylornithine deacetylase/succinyl-diaminopimelate desuccinylase-like protein
MMLRRSPFFPFKGILLLFLALSLPSLLAQPSLDDACRKAASASYRELLELLSIPNDQAVPADIQKNADWLEAAFKRHGFAARLLPNEGRPMVFAEWRVKPGLKTVLLYFHFDGQPVTPSEWKQESPWKPVLKKRGPAGAWEEIPLERLSGDVDPEWRIFGRSSSDDKSPIVMLLAAADALRALSLAPAVNVKVLLDSQEEKGSPSIPRVVASNREALAAEAVVIVDGPRHESGKPTMVLGNRGLVAATLTVFGAKGDLHSGHYGNYAPNPAQRLAALLATMKDENGRVTIPGFYDGISFDAEAKGLLASVPDDESALKKRLGIAGNDKVGATYQESLQYPSLNVRGLSSADVGAKARTVVPATAIAEIDMRTVPETPPTRLRDLLIKHVEAQGWHLVNGAPTDEERAKYPKLASLTFGDFDAQATASRADAASPAVRWLQASLTKTFGAPPVRIRTMGGTVPTRAIVDPLGMAFVGLPLVNADNSQHSANENLRLGNYVDGVRALSGLLREPW